MSGALDKPIVPDNIMVSDWDPSTWKDMPAADAIHALFEHANTDARNAVAWYKEAKDKKATASSIFRGAAIVLFVVGGLAPILAGFTGAADWKIVIAQSGYAILAIAAGVLAFDRYFGMSSGWIRYMTSLAAIERLRAEFLFNWAVLLQNAPAAIDDSTRLKFLERAQAFQRSVLEAVEKETAAWVAEFQTSVSDLEKAVQTQRQAVEANLQAAQKQEAEMLERKKKEEESAAADRRPGAINIELEGDLDGPAEIVLDGAKGKKTSARMMALPNLSKGQHLIEVRGLKQGKQISASKAVAVAPGAIEEIKFTLH